MLIPAAVAAVSRRNWAALSWNSIIRRPSVRPQIYDETEEERQLSQASSVVKSTDPTRAPWSQPIRTMATPILMISYRNSTANFRAPAALDRLHSTARWLDPANDAMLHVHLCCLGTTVNNEPGATRIRLHTVALCDAIRLSVQYCKSGA
jgi:hypothetical protein